MTAFLDGPRLLADIGGTNARFALETAPGACAAVAVLACRDYATLHDALAHYLDRADVQALAPQVRHGALAIANPVDGDTIRMTNHHWAFSIAALRDAFGLSTLLVVNDFTALAMALPHLDDTQRRQVGRGAVRADRAIGLLGAGTGLGVSGILPVDGGKRWVPLCSEGGHVTFSPVDEFETEVLRVLWRDHPHVSAERLLSGMGIELLHRVLCELEGTPVPALAAPLEAADITQRGLDGSCAVCARTVQLFCAMLGTVAGNLALTLGAGGGVYIGGGIVPRLGAAFEQSAFRARFEAKGRFTDYLAQVPTFVITADYPAFVGVSAILSEHLAAAAASSHHA
ncbi:MAG TPA: glucokinase [Burkholderiaceae bacterium]